jgi:UPF0716 protein FxsA
MPLLLVAALVVVPLVEIYVLIQVGQLIGPLPTIALLVVMSVVGAVLLKREGSRTWQAFREALAGGRVPAREVADGALVIFGGALLLTPGFASDAVGLFCVLPPTRAGLRRLLTGLVARRLGMAGMAGGLGVDLLGRTRGDQGSPGPRSGRATSGTVVDGEVVDGEVVDPPDRRERPAP